MWQEFFERMHGDIHGAIITDNMAALTSMLRDPSTCDLFYGFDAVSKSDLQAAAISPSALYGNKLILDGLVRLSEAVGARQLSNPESPSPRNALKGLDADKMKLLSPSAFLGGSDRYDLIVKRGLANRTRPVDRARVYLGDPGQRRPVPFHEASPFTVNELLAAENIAAASRAPCWVRRGYVEEIFGTRPSSLKA